MVVSWIFLPELKVKIDFLKYSSTWTAVTEHEAAAEMKFAPYLLSDDSHAYIYFHQTRTKATWIHFNDGNI